MAQSLNEDILRAFAISGKDIRSYSPLTLAYIGDAVFEIIVRTAVVGRGNAPVNKLHRHASHLVKASSQARILVAVSGELTEEEQDVVRRGRNSHPYTRAKNMSVSDYQEATGFEALMGWLYLRGEMDRAIDLSSKGIEAFFSEATSD